MHADLKDQRTPLSTRSNLKRHKIIVAGCVSISLGFLALSLIDLNKLVQSDVLVDNQMHITPVHSPQLDPSLHYANKISRWDQRLENGDLDNLQVVIQGTWFGNRYGFVNQTGQLAIKPRFTEAYRFHDGLAAATESDPKEQKVWGYINEAGTWAIAPQFNEAEDFHSGMAAVRRVSKGKLSTTYDLINSKGKTLVSGLPATPVIYDGCAVATINGMADLINDRGDWVLKPEYSHIEASKEGWMPTPTLNKGQYFIARRNYDGRYNQNPEFFLASKDGGWSVIDKKGNTLLQPISVPKTRIVDYANGVATIQSWSNEQELGFANARGTFIKPQFIDASPYDDLIAVKKRDDRGRESWYFMNRQGELLPNSRVDSIIRADHSHKWLNDGLGAVVVGEKCGFVNAKGQMVIPARFDWAEPFSQGYAPVSIDGYWQYIDTTGKLYPTKFVSLEKAAKLPNQVAAAILPGPLYDFVNSNEKESRLAELKSTRNTLKSRGNVPGNVYTPYAYCYYPTPHANYAE